MEIPKGNPIDGVSTPNQMTLRKLREQGLRNLVRLMGWDSRRAGKPENKQR